MGDVRKDGNQIDSARGHKGGSVDRSIVASGGLDKCWDEQLASGTRREEEPKVHLGVTNNHSWFSANSKGSMEH